VFRGSADINLDDKGRLAIPTKYRESLQECCERQMIVTLAVNDYGFGEPGCLWLYPLPEWEKVEHTISKLPTVNPVGKNLRKFFIGNATEVEMDAQGRLLLPEKLRKLSRLDKKISLVGQLNKFELWNAELRNTEEEDWMNGKGEVDMEILGTLTF
jgi:MraZ protein